jgi:hypothetical protein
LSVPVSDLVLVAITVALIFAAVSLPAWRLAQPPIATAIAYE